MKNTENKAIRFGAILLGAIWGVMLFLYGVNLVKIFNYKPTVYTGNYNYIAESVLSGDYGSLYLRMQNFAEDDGDLKKNPEYTELMAVHDYLEAAALLKMYKERGIDDLAKKYEIRLEEAKDGLEHLALCTEYIDEKFK